MLQNNDYDQIYQELSNKRKFLDNQKTIQQQDHNIQNLIENTLKVLKEWKIDKNELEQKHNEYLHQVESIVKKNKQSQQQFQVSEDKLYKLKTNLQNELLAWMPQVGLRHKKLLQQEQVDVKIKRHQQQNEEKRNQEVVLRGVSEDNARYIHNNLSKLAQPDIQVSPSKNQNQEVNDNESLAISALTKSVTNSQQKPNQIKFNQKQQYNSESQNFQESKQELQRGKLKSAIAYGDYEDEDENY